MPAVAATRAGVRADTGADLHLSVLWKLVTTGGTVAVLGEQLRRLVVTAHAEIPLPVPNPREQVFGRHG